MTIIIGRVAGLVLGSHQMSVTPHRMFWDARLKVVPWQRHNPEVLER